MKFPKPMDSFFFSFFHLLSFVDLVWCAALVGFYLSPLMFSKHTVRFKLDFFNGVCSVY
jgi:hypothetical protein